MNKEQEQQLILSVKDGINNASDTGSLTLHAEQAVLAHAAAHGVERMFIKDIMNYVWPK